MTSELRECLIAAVYWMAAMVVAAGVLRVAYALLAKDAKAMLSLNRRWVLAALLGAMSFYGVQSFSKGTNGTDNASSPTNGVDGTSFPTNGPPMFGAPLRLGADGDGGETPPPGPRITDIRVGEGAVEVRRAGQPAPVRSGRFSRW